jgi:hypothetical protein
MSLLFRQIAQYAARRIAANPHLRAKAADTARAALGEAQKIARENDRPRAAGRALRRALNKLQGDN